MLAFNIGFPLGFMVGRIAKETPMEVSTPLTPDDRMLAKVKEIQQRLLLTHADFKLKGPDDE